MITRAKQALEAPKGSGLAPLPVRKNKIQRAKPINTPQRVPFVTQPDSKGVLPWYKDEHIIARMEQVTALELQGYTYRQIAQIVNISLATVQADIDRMRTIRGAVPQDEETRKVNRQRSVEVFRAVQREAWRRLNPQPLLDLEEDTDKVDPKTGEVKDRPERGRKYLPTAREAAELLTQVVASEREIMRLQGTTQLEAAKEGFDNGNKEQLVVDITARFSRFFGQNQPGGAEGVPVDAHADAIEGSTVPLALLGEGEPAST